MLMLNVVVRLPGNAGGRLGSGHHRMESGGCVRGVLAGPVSVPVGHDGPQVPVYVALLRGVAGGVSPRYVVPRACLRVSGLPLPALSVHSSVGIREAGGDFGAHLGLAAGAEGDDAGFLGVFDGDADLGGVRASRRVGHGGGQAVGASALVVEGCCDGDLPAFVNGEIAGSVPREGEGQDVAVGVRGRQGLSHVRSGGGVL